MTQHHRRRIDHIQDPSFVADLDAIDIEVLRSRKSMCDDVENELSYYRRLLHGRLDLLAHERRLRRGETTKSLSDALPDILGDRTSGSGGPDSAAASTTTPPQLAHQGRRAIDAVLADGFLGRIEQMSDTELDEAEDRFKASEVEISGQRIAVHKAEEAIGVELTKRYQSMLADGDIGIDDLLDR